MATAVRTLTLPTFVSNEADMLLQIRHIANSTHGSSRTFYRDINYKQDLSYHTSGKC